ncbi:hypothetical protein EROM_050990 [Encephalitozoon romaleae SJ-2008]|uniref:Uncharacterized protein n=1 Tax=Encephalitozoon romaleae (strain SJ-2008) TaxID=1178016 RepID=I7AEE1_ENCRO|nr:hypothetical protein EROM_050990 [Encephalitozoon romaleae SJ-2008]AFN83030.1 hypothetical protein EROM_050990 [Encephalitozoon romaleae SJ-2008]
MTIVYEAVGMKRCARTGADFDRDLRRFSMLEKAVISMAYLLPIIIPSVAKSIDASYNLFLPLSMGLSASSFMPISARIARRFFDQDTVRIVTLHSSMVTIYVAIVFIYSLRMSAICYSNGFLESDISDGEMMYRMLILASYLFYDSGRLINRSVGLYRTFVVMSHLIGIFLISLLAIAYETGFASHSLLMQVFFCHSISSMVVSLAFDNFPSIITLKKDLDILPVVVSVGNLLTVILGVEIIFPRYNLNK